MSVPYRVPDITNEDLWSRFRKQSKSRNELKFNDNIDNDCLFYAKIIVDFGFFYEMAPVAINLRNKLSQLGGGALAQC